MSTETAPALAEKARSFAEEYFRNVRDGNWDRVMDGWTKKMDRGILEDRLISVVRAWGRVGASEYVATSVGNPEEPVTVTFQNRYENMPRIMEENVKVLVSGESAEIVNWTVKCVANDEDRNRALESVREFIAGVKNGVPESYGGFHESISPESLQTEVYDRIRSWGALRAAADPQWENRANGVNMLSLCVAMEYESRKHDEIFTFKVFEDGSMALMEWETRA